MQNIIYNKQHIVNYTIQSHMSYKILLYSSHISYAENVRFKVRFIALIDETNYALISAFWFQSCPLLKPLYTDNQRSYLQSDARSQP